MTPLFPARRSAERFDTLVEGSRPETADQSSADLLELVAALRSVPSAQARPEFVTDLRERLMLAAASELAPAAPVRERDDVARLTITPSRTRRERRIGVALGAVAILGATTSMAVASQSALPGDVLYPVKRGIENAQAGFSVGDDAKGETRLGNASTRLDEVDKLTRTKKPDATLVTHTLEVFTQQFSDGADSLLADYEANGNQHSIQLLHQNASDSMGALGGLDGVIPPAAHDALMNAAHTILAADAAAVTLCPDPGCGEGLLGLPNQLLAQGQQQDDAVDTEAGGQLPGADPSSGPSAAPQHNGGKGHQASGLNPPETPIQIPSPSTDATGLGGLLGESDTGTEENAGNGGSTGNGGNGGHGNGGKGHGGKGVTVDVTPVTTTVTEVVNGVVEGVTGLIGGLTGTGS